MVKLISELIGKFRQLKVLVVGDVILDEYIFGTAERISPEAPVPVVLEKSRMAKLGGAANVALNIKTLGANVELFGVIGNDYAGDTLVELLYGYDIDPHNLVRSQDRPTTLKQRIIAQKQQILRLDNEVRSNIPNTVANQLLDRIEKNLKEADAIVFSDYDKGVLNQYVIERLLGMTEGLIRFVDPKYKNFWLYRNVEFFKPNLKELSRALGVELEMVEVENLKNKALEAADRLKVKNLLVTLGEYGMLLVKNVSETIWIPAMKCEVFDVTGAGDTVAAVATLGAAAGLSAEEAALLASIAAGIEVTHLGVVAIRPEELEKGVEEHWEILKQKIGEPPVVNNNAD